MASKKLQDTGRLDFTASEDVTHDQPYLIGTVFGVVMHDTANGEDGVLDTEGTWEIACKSTDVIAVGDALWWDDTAKELTKTATGNYFVGKAWGAAASGITVVACKLLNAAKVVG